LTRAVPAAETVLHQVVRTHLDPFLPHTTAATEGAGLPRFTVREFRDFLGCGQLERGFAGVRCDACRFEPFVPFSCKARAICPGCGGRRMAAHPPPLVDAVLPWIILQRISGGPPRKDGVHLLWPAEQACHFRMRCTSGRPRLP
jgi:hypothetical protein